ncbi:hypothetical protein KM043_016764 [Ampulex compressa]|nr:hypothetical protein KM043_016764 [Ampulex compressa]
MNGSIAIAGVIAALSMAFAGFVAYRINSRTRLAPDTVFSELSALRDDSSLEDDLKDILGFVPLKEVREIVEKYARHDPQIAETISFVNDQKRFIVREFYWMPEFARMVAFLRENHLDIDGWQERIRRSWKTLPRFVETDPRIASGGLTVMISRILETIPRDELDDMLREKVKYSASFHRFLQVLRSEDYARLCNAIENNAVLHQHFFWAKESGIEITFAVELLRNLYVYLTEEI